MVLEKEEIVIVKVLNLLLDKFIKNEFYFL